MGRFGFKLTIQPGAEEEYLLRHQTVYPELLQAFREVGIKTYSIFMDGLTLFAYMEVDDFETAMETLNKHPANIKWQKFMSDILIKDASGLTMQVLPEVFFFKA